MFDPVLSKSHNSNRIVKRASVKGGWVWLCHKRSKPQQYITWLSRADSPDVFFSGVYYTLLSGALQHFNDRVEDLS